MALFKKEAPRLSIKEPELPELPKLPDLPEFPQRDYDRKNFLEEPLPQLPSFPSNNFGNKFSQSMIKNAISGGKESDEWFHEDKNETDDRVEPRGRDEFYAEREFPKFSSMMQRPLSHEIEESESNSYQVPTQFQSATRVVSKSQPVFVRLDKFEASLHTFAESKHKIMEIEKSLHDIRQIKDQEEKELQQWEQEVQTVKEQMEKIEKDLFSKI